MSILVGGFFNSLRGMWNPFHKSSAGSSDGRVRRPPRDARARSRRQGGAWACVCRATATHCRRRVALQTGFGKDIDDACTRRYPWRTASPPLVRVSRQSSHRRCRRAGDCRSVSSGPRSAEELAAATGVHGSARYRVLRLLVSEGVFAETEDGRFVLTPMVEALRGDVPR